MSIAKQEFEFKVGNLTVIVDCSVDYNYSSRASTNDTPAEEEYVIYKSSADEVLYYIEEDEVGQAEANQYYKDWIESVEQFVSERTLNQLIEVHCKHEAEEIAKNHNEND